MLLGTVCVSVGNADIFMSSNKVLEVIINISGACTKHKDVLLKQKVGLSLPFGCK